MKWLVIFALLINVSWAKESLVIPAFLEGARIYVASQDLKTDHLYLRPEIRVVYQLLKAKQINPNSLKPYLEAFPTPKKWLLKDDLFDKWIAKSHQNSNTDEVPEVSLHALKVHVVEESDDFFNDDIYGYFFVTDGVVPVGKVTSIYKGLEAGDSFFFNADDRVLFPQGIPAKRPDNHLIIDYGLIESDGDDIKDLQKLTSIIIDIAITVYNQYDSRNGQILINLRKEVKALAELLIGLNNDDRLVTGTFGYQSASLKDLFKERTYIEFKKNHKKISNFDSWEYNIHFRLLRK